MIDLVVKMDLWEFEMFIKPKIDYTSLDPRLTYWCDSRWNKYFHNWTWEDVDDDENEYSYYFSYSSNISEELKTRFRLSYNPNKVPETDFILSYLLNFIGKLGGIVQRVDVAFDYLGVATSDLTFDKGRKREYKIFKYPHSDFTYYLGKSGLNGSVKVYDKAREESIESEYNKTRYEVTVEPKVKIIDICNYNCNVDLPKMYFNGINGFYNSSDMLPGDKILVYAVDNGFHMDKLTYEQRKRYNKIKKEKGIGYTKIEPSQLEIEKVLKEFVNKTFLTLNIL